MFRFFSFLALIIAGYAHAGEISYVTVGVPAVPDGQAAHARWSRTADYLTDVVPGYRFTITPLDMEETRRALARRELDFVLTDPGLYVELAASHGIGTLATLKNQWQGQPYGVFGAVIVARADRNDIRRIDDLDGKYFMANSPDALELHLVYQEFREHGLDQPVNFPRLVFRNLSHDQIVYAVRDRVVDAGVVRTGVLERLVSEGKINMRDFHVLHLHRIQGFPFANSTDLIPMWAFSRTRHVPDALAQRVAVALLTMPESHPAAVAGQYAGWSAPLDYQAVRTLLGDTVVEPDPQDDTALFAKAVRRYYPWLLAGLMALLAMMTVTFYILRLNRRITHAKRSLEREMDVRRRAQETLRQSEEALRTLHRITSAQNLDFHEKLQALLAMGCGRFDLPIGILSRVEGDSYLIVEAVALDGTIAKGMVFPVSETYCCKTLQCEEPVSFEHASASEWATHPAYRAHKLESYFGIRVEVEGAVYGTLNFISPSPRVVLFTSTDKEILKHMAQWVAGEIQRQRAIVHALKLSGALEQTADVVMITDAVGRIEYVNPAFEQVTGYRREEVLGQLPNLVKSGHHDRAFYDRLWNTIRSGEVFREVFTNRRRDGSLYYEEKTITPLKDADGNIVDFIATGKDVTERRLAEEEARQRQAERAHAARVSTMGEMASALAHELNQPLTALSNYAQGCLHRLRAGGPPAELIPALEQMVEQSHRSAEIIRRLRKFVRKYDVQRAHTDINEVVRDASELADIEARRKQITLWLDLGNELPPVYADGILIEQVVLNLLRNSIEAIASASVRSPLREVHLCTARNANGDVEVTVRDSGPGFAADIAECAFNAFFTTKEEGMGLGLSLSRSIVEAHGGKLKAGSAPNGGAVAGFILPAA